MPSHATTPRICEQCGTTFTARVKRVNAGGAKFCRIECFRLASRVPPETAFWSHVHKTETCWLWYGSRNENGYGSLTIRTGKTQKVFKAHRFSWMLANGPIPPGLWVLHDCDVKACVRPEHLHLGDRPANIAEAVARGRIQSGERHWMRRSRHVTQPSEPSRP